MDKKRSVKGTARLMPSDFARMAKHIKPRTTWDRLPFPQSTLTKLKHISRKYTGDDSVVILFSGASRAGRTMAAKALANDLRLSLYQVDLSAVVGKYVGDTEKNLRRLFEAAENSDTILFLDEADALFDKRPEVKDSHDRYANMDLKYLLQRIESHRGLVILSTNLKSAIDGAFIRRLRFVVNFPTAA